MLSRRFQDALVYAAELHQSQVRKGSDTPYVAHLLAVASLVIENGGSEDEAIAALLHDAIEDQGGDATRQQIRARFGDEVTAIVDGCTDAEVVAQAALARTQRGVHRPYRRRLDRVGAAGVVGRQAAQRAIDLGRLSPARRKALEPLQRRAPGTLWYYRALVDAYRVAGGTPLLDELERTVSELERLAGV